MFLLINLKRIKELQKRGFDLELLARVVDTLVSQQPLDSKYHDHNLTGNYHHFRECHIEPDWLLIYRIVQLLRPSQRDGVIDYIISAFFYFSLLSKNITKIIL